MAEHRKTTPQQPPRQCLFCTNNANSPEHVWSKWMAPHFQRTAHDASEEYSQDFNPYTAGPPVRTQRHGHPTTLKLKVVCRVCNNGWMSTIEASAKPFVEPMLKGNRVKLNEKAQFAVATWMTLKMMVFEQSSWTQPVFTRAQTLHFAVSRSPACNMKMWLLRTKDSFAGTRATRGYAGLFKNAEDAFRKPPTANTQTVMFGIGQMLIFAIHSQLPDLQIATVRKNFSKRLWPARRTIAIWPPRDILNGAEAMNLSMTLQHYLGRFGTAVRPPS